jgi:FKBP-type peptidyl-prolyl cis-trans isomerase FklB
MLLLLGLLTGNGVAQETQSSNAQQTGTPSSVVQKSDGSAEEARKDSPPPAAAVFRNGKEKLSYALGVNLATGLKWQEIDVDPELVIRGFRDAISKEDKLLMPAKDLAETLKSFQEDRKRGIEHARQMLSDKNKKETSDFVAQNAKKEGIVTLPSGLQYKVLKQGNGKRPALTDTVVCNYRGTLLDGKEFDSSYRRNEPATIPVRGLIKGWTEALQLMPVGSRWQLFIPPQLGYGDKVVGDIGPNSTLLFEVELLSIQDKTQKVQDTPQNKASTPQGNS